MNRVILMGRLTRDPDVRYAQDGSGISNARYTLAVDRPVSKNNVSEDQPTADFIGCVAFGKTAEFVEKFLKKGTKILVEGRIQTGSYTNKDGQKVYTTDVVVDRHEFCEGKRDDAAAPVPQGQGVAVQQQYAQPTPQQQYTQAPAPEPQFAPIPDGLDDSLPFK